MADFPAARVPAGEEGSDLLTVGLGVEVLPVFGHVADEENRVVEHHEVLFARVRRVCHQFRAWHVEQLDGHAASVAHAVELREGVAIGQAHPGLPGLAWLGEDAGAQVAGDLGNYRHLGLHAAMGLGVGVAQNAGVVAVLFDDADGVVDDGLGLRGLTGGYHFFGGYRAGEFPAVVGLARQPADQADHQQDEEELAE
ncbi:hypothetical protein D3C84_515070 [compost metagenome]